MTSHTDMFDRDAAFAIADLPTTMTLRGQSFAISWAGDTQGQRADFEGMFTECDGVATVRTALFDSATPPIPRPRLNEVFTVGGRNFRISSIQAHPQDPVLDLFGVAETK